MRGALLLIAANRATVHLNLLLRLVQWLCIVHEVVHRANVAVRYGVLVVVASRVYVIFLLQSHLIDLLESSLAVVAR